jgi:hypothetical protein
LLAHQAKQAASGTARDKIQDVLVLATEYKRLLALLVKQQPSGKSLNAEYMLSVDQVSGKVSRWPFSRKTSVIAVF